jgi:response regulator RpfG family c-di-GMP phosphodiesterase
MEEKILFVDDDKNILEGYQRRLGRVLRVDVAEGGTQGLRDVMERGPYAVVVSDMHMPIMNGVDFLARVRDASPDTVRIMLTGNADINVAMRAVNTGSIFRFLVKPCPPDMMGEALVAGVKQYRLVTAEKTLLQETLNGAIEVLIEILSWADPKAFGQALELRGKARSIARELKAPDQWEIELAAMLSQLGYILFPKDLYEKAQTGGALSDMEKDMIKRLPEIGKDLIGRIPRLESVAKIILYQNKNYDGTGFPEDNVAGVAIPLGARILKVLQDLRKHEARGVARKTALALMQGAANTYDMLVVDAAIAVLGVMDKTPSFASKDNVEGTHSSLKIGDCLVDGIRSKSGMLLIGPGYEITQALLVKISFFAAIDGIEEPIKVRREQTY